MPQGLAVPPQPKAAPPPEQNPTPQLSSNVGVANVQRELAGQRLSPTEAQPIIINGQNTGRYFTGGDLVGNAPIGYQTQDPYQQQPDQLKNYDKLTGPEQWLMQALPGLPKPLTEMLDNFNNSWPGKALSYLDWPAEQVERFTGFVSQAAAAYGNPQQWQEFNTNLKAAWYAGSLSADMANLGFDISADKTKGLSITQYHDLPGIEGVIQSRQKIAQLVNQGMGYDEALTQTKASYLESQGALALRAQLQDTAVHLFGDPLNALLPFLKPVEYLHAWRAGILAQKVVEPAVAAEKVIATAEEAVRVAEEGVKLAETAGDAEKLAQATATASEAQKALEIAHEAQASAALVKLTPAERFVVGITGGLDTEAKTYLNLEKAGQLVGKGKIPELALEIMKAANPLRLLELTPESKAIEYTHIVMENINSRVIAGSVLADGTYDVNKIVRSIMRGAAGTASPELGHMVATLEGQHVVGVMKEIADGAAKVGAEFNAAAKWERPLINLIGVVVGEHPAALLKQIENGEHLALFTRFTEKLAANPEMATAFDKLLLTNNLPREFFTADDMRSALSVFKGNNLYDSGVAIAQIGNLIADASAKQAIARFGLEHRGFLPALSDLTKQAESLAFLKLNPAYPVRNFYNNVVTMYARGALGNMTPEAINSLWELTGFKPTRLFEGVGMAGIEQAAIGEVATAGKGISPLEHGTVLARQAIADATAPKSGVITKLEDSLRSLSQKVPKGIDFSRYSQEIEKWASANATATFYMRGLNQYGQTGKMWLKIADFSPELAKELGPEATRQLEHFTQEAYLNPANLDKLVASGDFQPTVSALRDAVESRFGRPLSGVIPDEFMATAHQDISAALASRDPVKVNQVFESLNSKLEAHIESLNDGAFKTLTDETLARTKIEGPGAFGKVYGDAVDEWWSGHARHALDEGVTAEQIRNLGNPELRNSQWKVNFAQTQSYWDRQWNRLEARLNGLAQGAQEAGLTSRAQEVADTMAAWKGDWKEFFAYREQSLKNFFANEGKGAGAIEWNKVTQDLDTRYQAIIQNEAKYTAQIDAVTAEMMPPEQRALFTTWRERVNALRTDDKAALLEFRQKIRNLPYDQIQNEYGIFTQDRLSRYNAAWQEERSGLAALQGSPEAGAQYVEGIANHTQIQDAALQAIQKKTSGATLAPEEQAALDAYIRKVDPATADYIDSLKGQLQEAQTVKSPEQLTQIEKRLAQAKLQEGAQTAEQGGLLARMKKAEQAVEAKPIVRNWRAGGNNGTIQFASEAQRDLYDAGAASSRSIRDVGSRGVDLNAPKTANLDAIASKYGITREEASKLASQVYADVRSQAKGIAEGETRKLTDTISGLSNKPTSAAEQAANITTRDKTLAGVMADRLDNKALRDYGWTRGKPGILNAVNADRADAGLPKYAALSEVPFDEAVKAVDKRVGTTADLAKKAVLAPRSELPANLSDEMQQTAKWLADELSSGSAPGVYGAGGPQTETNVFAERGRYGSSLPDWFQEISRKYKVGREDVFKAIDKVIADAGTDKGKIVEGVKQAILDAMSSTNPLTGEPPTPEILRMLGKPEEEIKAAEDAWKALGAVPPTIEPTGNLAADLQAEITQTEQQVVAKFGTHTPPVGSGVQQQSFFPDFETLVKPEQYTGTGLDQLNFNHGQEALRLMQEEALKSIEQTPSKWADKISPDGEARLQRYLEHVKGGYSDARYASTRFAEYGRDSALLNYNRRMNYNAALGTIFPYEFWATQSAMKWALHSIDRPAMLTTYLRLKQFLETAYRPEAGFPSRLKDMLRIPLPFMPDWMGKDVFINPLEIALPFDKFMSPYEQYQQQQTSDLGATTRKLQELRDGGQISDAEFQSASQSQSGPTWDRAVTLARQDDSQDRLNGWDFAALFTSPHAPLQWAINAAQGKETGNVLPLTNTIGAVQGAFGIDPAGGLNLEASIRKKLGFHPFNQWDDYYVDRELANLAGDGTISASDARQAMIDRKGPAYDLAYQRVGMEKSGGPAGAFLGLLGLPVHAYPVGEEHLRQLQDEYTAAGKAYDQTGDYASTLGKFNEAHPEYEARLALYKKPEERLNQFLVDNLWNKWNEMPDVYKHEISNQLGQQFQEQFLNKDTRNTKNIPPDLLATWLKLMGGNPPGSLTPVQGTQPLTLPSQDVAYRAQTFYDGRDNMFPGVLDMQTEYFNLQSKGEQKQYLASHRLLSQYWAWRKDFMLRNPETVPYLTDLTKNQPPKGYQQALAKSDNQPHLTWDEWKMTMGWNLSNLVQDYGRGDPLPTIARTKLQDIATKYGWHGSLDDFAKFILESQ